MGTEVKRVWGVIIRVACVIGAIMLAAMMLLTTADVLGRYFLNSPIFGALEATEMLMVAVVFLSLAYIQASNGHIKIELFTERLPQRVRACLAVVELVVGISVFSIFTWRSGYDTWWAYVTHNVTPGLMKIPLWPAKSLVALGCAMLVVAFVLDLIDNVGKLRKTE